MSKPCSCNCINNEAVKLNFGILDYFKVIYSWLRAFRKTFSILPGLYYLGKNYDINTPLLVTSNYHMTVFLLWKKLRNINIRVLIINTDGINVWCSSGKGKFSAENILSLLSKYTGQLTDNVELILPKLSMSGVCLKTLKEANITPKIGPIYMADLPKYLKNLPLKNRNEDKYLFNFKDRMFSFIPTFFQQLSLALIPITVMAILDFFFNTFVSWQLLLLIFIFNFLYIALFSYLPSKGFVVKSLPLIIISILFWIIDFKFLNFWVKDIYLLFFYFCFSISYFVYFALAYTGCSGVSNYSLVKKEIIRYLPVSFGFLGLIVLIIKVVY